MSAFNDHLRTLLLQCPSLFATPLDVMVQTFGVLGGGLHWQEGEVVGESNTQQVGMDYADLDEEDERLRRRREECARISEPESLGGEDPLIAKWQLQIDRKRMGRQFTEQHIETIVSTALVGLLEEEGSIHAHYLQHTHAYPELNAFAFPNDIKPDWGLALNKFLEYWEVSLRKQHGANQTDMNDRSGWPDQAKELLHAIQDAKSRLYPLLNGGESLADGLERRRALASRWLGDLGDKLNPEPRSKKPAP